jgi:hypothetical protein
MFDIVFFFYYIWLFIRQNITTNNNKWGMHLYVFGFFVFVFDLLYRGNLILLGSFLWTTLICECVCLLFGVVGGSMILTELEMGWIWKWLFSHLFCPGTLLEDVDRRPGVNWLRGRLPGTWCGVLSPKGLAGPSGRSYREAEMIFANRRSAPRDTRSISDRSSGWTDPVPRTTYQHLKPRRPGRGSTQPNTH